MTLELRPVTLREAARFVAQHHRHTAKPPRGWRFGVAVVTDGETVGVAIASRPTSRELDDGRTIEVVRCCTDGTPNACTRLYGAIHRAAKALGYTSAVTYTLAAETGASVKAAGYQLEAALPARHHGGGRDRYDTNLLGEPTRPADAKHRWRRTL